ncbi:MAG: DUF1343 domain-containing protein [Ignavibacteriales bacterium]|nr:DUF1343 domain-containing protein [Ignavibacteriales bacterium]
MHTAQGKRVGLVVNPTGVTADLEQTIDMLFNAPGIQLGALFGPEHGGEALLLHTQAPFAVRGRRALATSECPSHFRTLIVLAKRAYRCN